MTHSQSGVDQPTSTEQLAAAFNLFNQLSDNLGESYRELQQRVTNLNSELAVERTQRFADMAAKEQLANRLSNLLTHLPGGVIVLSDSDQITDANPVAKALLCEHLFDGQLVGQSWENVLNGNSRSALSAEAMFAQSEVLFRNGTCISLSARVLDAKGSGIVLITDVTDAKIARENENREQRLTALGEMSARLAHQLRTPLSAALLYVSQLSTCEQSAEMRASICSKLEERIAYLETLINSMLSFVRGEARAYEMFGVDEVLEKLVGLADLVASQRGGKVVQTCHSANLMVFGCSQELLSALIGLVENAFQISDGVTLTISVQHDDQWIDIFIEDDGPGMNAAESEKIFDPYYSNRANGTGLGLAIAQVTAKEHGGSLELLRSGEGGSVFRFRLPAKNHDEFSNVEVLFCD